LLTGGRRTALARQQTLAATVDWSYDLLSETERALFRRSSVFVEGFDLDAAEGVCPLTDIAEWEIADLLASLVDKSLVVAEPHDDGLRYRLQETLRQYGAERLAEGVVTEDAGSEAELVADAHANYFLTVAEQAETDLQGRSFRACLGRLGADDLNLRAAIKHALASPESPDQVLRQFWAAQRYWRDARQPAL
jgi:predicted ATPase